MEKEGDREMRDDSRQREGTSELLSPPLRRHSLAIAFLTSPPTFNFSPE